MKKNFGNQWHILVMMHLEPSSAYEIMV